MTVKIMHIMAGAATGGAELFFLDCVTTLADTPELQQAVVIRPDAYREQRLKEKRVPVYHSSFNRWLRFLGRRSIRRAIKEFKPDIVQYWMGRAGEHAVAGDHINVAWYGSYYNRSKRFATCDHHIVVTHDVRRHVIETGAHPDDVTVIHTTVSFGDDLSPVERAEFDTPEDAIVLLSLARLHPVKGIDVLLRAMVDLPPNYVAWLAGDGELREELEQLAITLGVVDRVRFLGWHNDRERLLAACDVVVFPTRGDAFGTVMVDAWAMSKPIVATDAPGPKAYLQDRIDGMLVVRDDPAAFAAAVEDVITDASLRETLIKNGWNKYQNMFSKQALTRDSLSLYRKLVDRYAVRKTR